jgi:hypothetical protein
MSDRFFRSFTWYRFDWYLRCCQNTETHARQAVVQAIRIANFVEFQKIITTILKKKKKIVHGTIEIIKNTPWYMKSDDIQNTSDMTF